MAIEKWRGEEKEFYPPKYVLIILFYRIRFIIFQQTMNKSTKKELLKLKFDTSLDNLACFIKNQPKGQQTENSDRYLPTNRKKIKSSKQKAIQFQNDAFLESILANVFRDEFGNPEEIKRLVKESKLVDEEEIKEQLSNNGKKKCQDQIFNNSPDKNPIPEDLFSHHLFVSQWKNSLQEKQKIDKGWSTTRVGTEETPDNSYIEEKTQTNEKYHQYPSSNLIQMPPSYTQCYNYYGYQPLERKKRTITKEEALEFRIDLRNVEMDGRTTLMIRNIPNKYSQELLLEQLKQHKMKFDFFYLPIDYNNDCNVGYAFINFIHAKFIPDFYQEFHGRKWNKFNSEKICSLAYARIQGTSALRNHFKHSHVMQQRDKRFRPLLSHELDEDKRNSLNRMLENQREKF